jgi:hypothetical protein
VGVFLNTALPPGMSKEAADMMKDVFYCGAAALFDTMTNTVGEMEEEAAMALASMHQEMQEHAVGLALRAIKTRQQKGGA